MDVAAVEDVPTLFRSTDVLPDLDARALALVDGEVYAGTASGLFRLSGDGFEAVALEGSGSVADLAVTADGRLLVARAADVIVVDEQGLPGTPWSAGSRIVHAVLDVGGTVYAGTDQGLFTVDATGPSAVVAAQGFSVRGLAAQGGVVWMATSVGVARYDSAADTALPTLTAPAFLADDDVRALVTSSDGSEIVAATAEGVSRIAADVSDAVIIVPGLDGLPNADVTAVAEHDGEVLSGHALGATAMSAAARDHYHSERWLPAEAVRDVALAADRTRWLATEGGISRIALVNRTLLEKAQVNEGFNARHWRMDGFVSDNAVFADAWDHSAPPSVWDHDNDGLWTEMQIAAWCFAYATTGDEAFYANARRAMDVMQLQIDVPAVTFTAAGLAPGFITRSLVREDEGAVFDDKATMDNWHLEQHDGTTYSWKDDTSADEYTGHFFGIPIFYDLCAQTEDERRAIRDRVHMVLTYLVDNDYHLIDLDGLPTTHGHWEDLGGGADGDLGACAASGKSHCAEAVFGGGWLNGMQILGFLLAGWHITGDDRFYDEYERLAVTERYGELVPIKDLYLTITSPALANHSDHELATLAYFTLLRYEPNPERRAIWVQSLRDFHAWEKEERNALEIAVMTSALDDPPTADLARTLHEMSPDWREFLVDNGHRQDAERDVRDRFGDEQWKTVLPYDEIRTMKWNGNPHVVVGGGNANSVQAPWPWLLPYWMARYYGVIE